MLASSSVKKLAPYGRNIMNTMVDAMVGQNALPPPPIVARLKLMLRPMDTLVHFFCEAPLLT